MAAKDERNAKQTAEGDDDERKTQRMPARLFDELNDARRAPAVVGSARSVTATGALDPVLKPRLVEVLDGPRAPPEPGVASAIVIHEDLASRGLIAAALEQLRSGDLDDDERAYLERIVAVRRPAATTIEVPDKPAAPAEIASSPPRATSETIPNPRDLVEEILATAPSDKRPAIASGQAVAGRQAIAMRPITRPPTPVPLAEVEHEPARADIGLVIVVCVIVLGVIGAIVVFAAAG